MTVTDGLVPTPSAAVPSAMAPPAHYHFVKRAIDIIIALSMLVLLAPVLLVVALVVRTTSRGPVFFRQSRVGHGGVPFIVLKFRSMCANAEARLRDENLYESYVANGFKLQAAHEPRLTRAGRVLRRTSLDELPQLLNVLRGDMSLVGPRPVVPEELANYGEFAPYYLAVRPGLTGMWQVNGRSTVQFPARAELDLKYFDQRSIRLDLAILARTPIAVLRGNGAH